MEKEDKKRIENFFREKTYNPGENSSLALLRNDMDRCFTSGILYPGVVGIMTGIDLLAKFYKGEDSINGVGKRFDNFLKDYFYLKDKEERKYVYQLRNAMLHSCGLFSIDNKNIIYRFTLRQNGKFMLYSKEDSVARVSINIWELRERFNQAIYFYKKDLIERKEVLDNFKKIEIERYLQKIS
jgi:hypothetical protein